MTLQRITLAFGLLSTLLLSGCGNIYNQKDPKAHHYQAPAVRQAQLAKVKTWRADGSLSIRQRPGQRSDIANFTWDEVNQKDYRVGIFSALDLYQLQIFYQFGVATLWKNGSFFRSARTPERLMQKALGWSIPVREAGYWLKGMPAKRSHYVAQYDRYGHIATLEQKGWLITYQDYRTNVNGVDIPRRIKLQRPGLLIKIAMSRFYWIMSPNRLPSIKG